MNIGEQVKLLSLYYRIDEVIENVGVKLSACDEEGVVDFDIKLEARIIILPEEYLDLIDMERYEENHTYYLGDLRFIVLGDLNGELKVRVTCEDTGFPLDFYTASLEAL